MRRIVGAAVASVLVLGSMVEELVLVEVEELELELEELLLELDELLEELLLLMVAFIAEDSVVVLLAVALLPAVDSETELSVVTFAGKVVFPKGSGVVLLPVGLSVVVEFSVSVSRKFIKTSINFKMEPRSSLLKVCASVSPISHAPQAKPNSSSTTKR